MGFFIYVEILVSRQTAPQYGSPESTNLGHSASDDSTVFLSLISILWS